MTPGTRGDGLRLQLAGVDVVSLRWLGSLPGIVVTGVAARNGVGTGMVSVVSTPGGGVTPGLVWRAPGSAAFGPAALVMGDGEYLLEDGSDASKWIRLQVTAAYLPMSGAAQIYLSDAYNGLGPADVAAADAAAGLVTTTQYTLKNVSPNVVQNVKLWLDNTAAGFSALAVSSDGVNYFQPASEGDTHVLALGTLAIGASVTVWVKRTIGAAAASTPSILNVLQFSWSSMN